MPEVQMIVGVPKETYPNELRVALVPAVLPILAKLGLDVLVEKGAGLGAGHADEAYEKQGASIAAGRSQLFKTAEKDINTGALCQRNHLNGFFRCGFFRCVHKASTMPDYLLNKGFNIAIKF